MLKFKIRLKELREGRGYSQKELASLVGVDRSYITRIEQGQRQPGLAIMYRLLHLLGCRFEELVTLESNKGMQ